MELTRESICVKIIMLKTVITNENGYGGTLEGVPFSSLHSSQPASERLDAGFVFHYEQKEVIV